MVNALISQVLWSFNPQKGRQKERGGDRQGDRQRKRKVDTERGRDREGHVVRGTEVDRFIKECKYKKIIEMRNLRTH